MERIDNLLPDAGKITAGSSGSRRRRNEALRLDDRVCPHCGRELQAEWVEFPPALQRKFGRPGEWYYHPCTPECERKNERKEWELMRRNARIAALRERSGLSRRMKGYTLSGFNPYVSPAAAKALEKVESYLKNWEENREQGRGLYFCGGVGTGKTHLAVAVMNELIQRRRVPSLFVTVPELLDNLRGAYNDPGRDLDEWMDAVKNAELLLLDDLGAEKANEWVRERLFVIINHRYRETLPTIFTSNIGPEELPRQLGERTASRIIAMCEGVELEGPDYREKLRNERGA
ncbi:ATP-binding protein [Rubrobacter xylanophilus]|uniref:ATP-binding protein n=1 Tax=Rubrobacter xylanophilus TaxID=49319 RepID=UPI001C63F4AD|nr:ATP-binding protein [Rubrobacter xylanophilus]